ncbi:ComEC/Rec2 family competence protein [Candidatus Saccharibacteria bacterium]|nr:ComEC/Rec2 family competence protein [Candidatus Saccharibacteria bacterium]
MKNKKYHISWLISWASVGLLVGTFISLYTSRFIGFEWVVIGVCLGVVGTLRKDKIGILAFLIAGLFFGLWRGGNQIISQSGFEQFYGKEVVITGRVLEDPSYDTDGDLRLRLTDVRFEQEKMGGEVWVVIRDNLKIRRSDIVTVEGLLSKGFGTIPSAIFRAEVLAVERKDFADVGLDTRDWFAGGIRTAIDEPEASLGAGFLLGEKSALPEKLEQDLRLLGLTHIVVASGYNLTILIRFARRFFARISRFTALSASGFLIFAFANITGFSPSMTRASLIAGLSLLAWYFGRKFHPLVLLPFSAAVTVAINPAYAWGDIGWLLSFMSFVGVIMLAPLIHAFFWGDRKPGNIRQVFIETMSAQLLTLPIIAVAFGQYSSLSLLANVLILPLIPLAMALVFVAGAGGLALPSLAGIIGWPAEILLRYMTTVVDKLAVLPQATSEIKFTSTSVVVSYLLIFCTMIYLWRRTNYVFRNYNIVE